MKKLMLIALIALNTVWTSDKLLAMDPPVAENRDSENQLEYDEMPASQTRRRTSRQKKKRKRSSKKKEAVQPDDTSANPLEILVDTGEQVYNFEQAHQDKIISGAQTAVAVVQTVEQVADKVIGDGDGKLTLEGAAQTDTDDPRSIVIEDNQGEEPANVDGQKLAAGAQDLMIKGHEENIQKTGELEGGEIPEPQIFRTPRKKKQDKSSDTKKENPSDIKKTSNADGSTLETLVNTGKQVVDFVEDHKDEIIEGAETAETVVQKVEQVADKVIGNGDGKLTLDEGTDFLKKIGGALGKVKDHIAGAFKKDKPADSKTSSAPVVRGKRRSNRRPRKQKSDAKPSNNKKSGNADGSTLETLVNTGKQGVDFIVDHKDQIIAGAKTAETVVQKVEQVADKVIGNGDGKVTLDEVTDFLKKIGGALSKVKDHIAGAFQKDKPADSDIASNLSIDSAPVMRNKSSTSSWSIVGGAAQEAKKALDTLQDLLRSKIAIKLIELEDFGDLTDCEGRVVQMLQLFIQSHSDLQTRVGHLLDRLSGKHMRGGPDKDIEIINKFAESFIAAQEGADDYRNINIIDNQDGDQSEEPVTGNGKNPDQRALDFTGNDEEDMQKEGGLFEQLIGYQNTDEKLTVADVPDILKALIKTIGNVQGLVAKLGSKKKEAPKRSFKHGPAVDCAVMTQVASGLIDVGTRLTQLSAALRVSPEELKKVIKHMNVEELHKYLNEGDDEVIPLDAQLQKYVTICTPHRGTIIDLQAIGECLQVTRAFALHLQEVCAVVDVVANNAQQTSYGRWASKLNSKQVLVSLGAVVTGITALLASGEQFGWWDVYTG